MSELSVFLPCHDEEGNVERVVSDALTHLEALDLDAFEVIVVNDGSQDGTGAVADRLATSDPRVRVVHHHRNRGYGAALRSGFAAARLDWVFLTDGDGQFDLAQLGPFLEQGQAHDLVVGYRRNRSDHWLRRANTWAWGRLVNAVFDLRVRDVDCAFKLVRRKWVEAVDPLESDGAFASTELLAKLRRAGVEAREVPVTHQARQWGQASGADPLVIARAFGDLRRLRRRLGRD